MNAERMVFMRGFHMGIVAIVVMAAGAVAAAQTAAPEPLAGRFAVEQVLAVRSASVFECRLADYPYSKTARFRVHLRGVTASPQIPPAQAQEYLTERLKGADHIQLNNIRFRNYFRLTADVIVDGRDLAAELVAQRIARPVSETVSDGAAEGGNSGPRPASRVQHRAVATAQADRLPTAVVTLESLLAARVNLSAINDETTLQEALAILSQSVRPRLPLVVLWNDLERNALVRKDMPVGLAGFGVMELRQALKLILLSVSRAGGLKPELAFEGRVITIGTQRGLLQKAGLKTYAVEDLTAPSFTEDGDLNRTKMDDLMGAVKGRTGR